MRSLPFAICALFIFCACQSKPPVDNAPSFLEQGDRIVLKMNSKFVNHLNFIRAKSAASGNLDLRAVGQMIALANPSGALKGSPISWVELSPELSKLVGLRLASISNVTLGTAIGVTSVPIEYLERIKAEQQLQITRYGLKGSKISARVLSVHAQAGELGVLYVLFQIRSGQDWFPGTNCEISFPLLQGHPVEIPTTALLHEGAREYVIKQLSPGILTAAGVSVIQDSDKEVWVMGIQANDILVGSGAILLKPALHTILTPTAGTSTGATHAQ